MKQGQKIIGLALLLPLAFGGGVLGGQESENSAQAASPQRDAAGTYVLHSRTQLVLIPALVRDGNGHHIAGLKAGDFTVKDNGKIRRVTMAEEITAPPATELERAKLPPGTYSNDVAHAKAPLRVVIILFDMLNSHFKDQVPARIQLTKYLNEQIQPGTLVALLGLGRGGLRMYHDLTSDTQGLGKELADAMATGRHSISTNLQGEMSETESEEAFVGHGGFAQTNSSGRSSKKLIVLDTLDAFKNIAGAYSSIPGRKSLVWVTGGFPFTLDDSKASSKDAPRDSKGGGHGGGGSSRGGGGPPGMAGMDKDSLVDILPDYQAAWQALNDANIALYPVDMHGLMNTAEPDATYKAKRGGNTAEQLSNAPGRKEEKAEDNIQSMTAFANETGGKAFYNDNDMVEGFREAVADSESSYLLGYYLEGNATGGWHKLQVEVDRPGTHIRARAGFLVPKENAAQLEAGTKAPTTTQKKPAPPMQDVNLAMTSPMNYTGIPITVKWLNSEKLKAAATTGPDAGRMAVPFQIVLPPEAVRLASDDSTISLEFVGLARSAHGEDAADFVKKLDGKLKPDVAKRLLLAGIKFDSQVLLAPGYYNVRFVVRDNINGNIGSVTAPVVVKKADGSLPPAAAEDTDQDVKPDASPH